MTSKERVRRALNFKEPDRIPMDFSCEPDVEEKFLSFLHIEKRRYFNNPFVNIVDSHILDFLHCDFRYIGPVYLKNKVNPLELRGYPLKGASMEEVENYPWPGSDDFDFGTIAEQCKEFEGYPIVTGSPGNVDFINKACCLYGAEAVYRGLIKKDPLLFRIFQKISDFFYEYNSRIFESARGMVDLIFYGDDYGGQGNSLIGKETYREIMLPLWNRHLELAKTYGTKIIHHSCGSISNLIPTMYEAGINVIDPLQSDIKNMKLHILKKDFYGKIAFHGGICFEKCSSVNEVRKKVRQVLAIMAPGGGYIMAPTTIVTSDIPLDYIIEAYEEAKGNIYELEFISTY